MRVDEYLSFRAKLKGIARRRRRERMEEVKVLCGLKEAERRIIGQLSNGYVRRLALADSLMHSPELLILDEPMAGLDPGQAGAIRELIGSLGKRWTVALTTHSLAEAESVCQRVFIMNRGRIAASDSPERLAGLLRGNASVLAEIAGAPDEVAGRLKEVRGVLAVIALEPAIGDHVREPSPWHRYRLDCPAGTDIRPAVFEVVSARGWPLRELSLGAGGLQEAWNELTVAAGREQSPTSARYKA
jgi:ABC-2 type transport system ATP-binding protein